MCYMCFKSKMFNQLNLIFAKVEQLADKVSSRSFNFEMKKLLDKFTKGKAVEFFLKMYPELRDNEYFLNHDVLENLKTLCN